MTTRRLLLASFILGFLAPRAALALDWEIERNFRYFLYPSDVAAQRVARDLYAAKNGAAPTPEQLEHFINGPAFWTTKLSEAGDLAKSWPIEWPRDAAATPYDLVKQLRAEEGRPPPPLEPELDRRGWASLLVRERPEGPTLTGSTATCWNPVQRLHNGCAVWGDYVRAPGWIVRVFDPDAAAGQTCQWTFAGAVPASADPRRLSRRRSGRSEQARRPSRAIAANFASSSPPIRPTPSPSPARRPSRGQWTARRRA